MSEPAEVTETNVARLARESRSRQRGDLPEAPPGSLAEQMGYAPAVIHAPLAVTVADRNERRRLGLIARREWLDWRRSGVGASDIAAIMGWGFANSSPYAVWCQKVGLTPAGSLEDDERFEYGHRAEPMLAQWFEDETGLYVGSLQEQRVHPEVDWALATIDGEVFEGPAEQSEPIAGLELKTASSHTWKADDPIPDMYVCQGLWQCFVCGWDRVYFAVLHEQKFRVYLLERDDEDIAVLREAAERFWVDHVLTADPPPVDASPATRTALGQAYRGDRDRTTAYMPDQAEMLASLREARHQLDVWKRTAATYENALKEQMRDATYADFGNGPEVTWSRFTRKSVDSKVLKADYPDVYDAVLKTSDTSTFRVAGAREDDD